MLFEVELEDGSIVLVAQTEAGYVGFPPFCPHKMANLKLKGVVDPVECVLTCGGDFITYSLRDGQAVRNVGAQGEDPGELTLIEVIRVGDNFIFPRSSPF